MTTNNCEFVAQFIADPNSFLQEARARRDELLVHFSQCPECQSRIDELSDENAAMLFEILAGGEESWDAEEGRQVDEATKADAKLEDSIRKAVQDALIPGFFGLSAAGKLAKNFDPVVLYSSTEAVSMLVRRHLKLNGRGRVAHLELNPGGSLWANGREVISAEEIAKEIARFANLWALEDTAAHAAKRFSPIDQGRQLAEWIFLALHERRNLLRDFRASLAHSAYVGRLTLGNMKKKLLGVTPMSFVKADVPLWLIPLQAADRIDDLNERWRPLAPDPAFVYAVPRREAVMKSGLTPIVQFTTEQFSGMCSSCWAPAVSSPLESNFTEMTFFVADTKLSVVEPNATRSMQVVMDTGYQGPCTVVGRYKQVTFEQGCKVELVDIKDRRSTKRVQRLDVPILIDLKAQ